MSMAQAPSIELDQETNERLLLETVTAAINARVTRRDGRGMTVEQVLPFLKLRTGVRDESRRRCLIESVGIVIEDEVPRLVMRLGYESPFLEQRASDTAAGRSAVHDSHQGESRGSEQALLAARSSIGARLTLPYAPAMPPPLPSRRNDRSVTATDTKGARSELVPGAARASASGIRRLMLALRRGLSACVGVYAVACVLLALALAWAVRPGARLWQRLFRSGAGAAGSGGSSPSSQALQAVEPEPMGALPSVATPSGRDVAPPRRITSHPRRITSHPRRSPPASRAQRRPRKACPQRRSLPRPAARTQQEAAVSPRVRTTVCSALPRPARAPARGGSSQEAAAGSSATRTMRTPTSPSMSTSSPVAMAAGPARNTTCSPIRRPVLRT